MSSNFESPPPKYEEIVEMGDVGKAPSFSPSAPLLPVDFKGATTIKIVKAETKRRYGPFKFYIQESTTDAALFQGEVGFNRSASVTGNDGSPFAKITDMRDPTAAYMIVQEFRKCAQFNISRKNKSDGMLAVHTDLKLTFVTEEGTQPYSFQITDVDKDKEIKETVVLISRNDGESPLVKVTCPEKKGYEPYECTIEFSEKTDEPVTEDEKEFITSLIVAFMTYRVGAVMTIYEHYFWVGLGAVFVLGLFALIIWGIVALFEHLNANCNKPGYRCKGTHYSG